MASIRRQVWRRIFAMMIESARKRLGRSREQAATLAGMESSEWAAIEAGHVPADPARLRAMAASLEIRFEQMENMVLLCREAWLA
jgi:transcriptional regulator with XRE-family HTH domain